MRKVQAYYQCVQTTLQARLLLALAFSLLIPLRALPCYGQTGRDADSKTTDQPAPDSPPPALSPKSPPIPAHLDIYGLAIPDNGYSAGTVDPNWFDVMHPSKPPAFNDEFGGNGNWFAANNEQQTAPPVSKPPKPQSPPGAQPPATQQAPLGSEDSVGTQQPPAGVQDSPPPDPQDARLDIYGFAMLDTGFNAGTINPNWFDVVRPTQLPSFKNEFGKNGNWFAGVRQSRFGVKGFIPTSHGEIKTIFEFELFGTGVDAGQTTFRLRHAFGEFHKIGAGQTWSVFMDPDVFPNEIEYWGPNGMVFFRNVQLRYTPWSSGDSNFAVAIERPGASADGGIYSDRIELQNVKPRFPLPDITGHLRLGGKWGHFQIAGILRDIRWDDLLPNDQFNLTGGVIGWGVNVSSNIKIRKDVIRLQAVYGDGIENYMNDAPVDVAVANNLSNPIRPIIGKALPVLGTVSFYDHTWSDKFTSSIGYSLVNIENTSAQLPSEFKRGQYAIANLLYYPVKGVMMGGELQWGRRANHSDGFIYNDYRIQFSFKYDFAFTLKR